MGITNAAKEYLVPSLALTIFRGVIAIAYTIGGVTHIANLIGHGPPTPASKRIVFRSLDVVYVLLDATVVVGMVMGTAWGYATFFAAAGSQLVLYVGFPGYFASTDVERSQLRGLVRFHIATAAAMTALLLTADLAGA